MFSLFAHYYNHLRPYQSLDGRTLVEEVLDYTVPVASPCMRSGGPYCSTGRSFDIHISDQREAVTQDPWYPV